jgi:hypothetical protein
LDEVMAQLQSEAAQEDQATQQSEQSEANSDTAQQNHQLTQQEAGAANTATQHPQIPTLASFAPSPPPPPKGTFFLASCNVAHRALHFHASLTWQRASCAAAIKALKKKEKDAEMSGSIASGTR